MTSRAFTSLLALTLVSSWHSSADADILLVHADGSGEYATIQDAIDAAVDGDEVLLTAGVFRGDGNREIRYHGKAIVVDGAGEATIDPESSYGGEIRRSFVFDAGEEANSILAGVTISCGWVNEYVATTGSVVIEGASPTFQGCSFVGADGRAVDASGGHPRFEDCYWTLNSFVEEGASCIRADAATLIDCLFGHNNGVADNGTGSIGLAIMKRVVVEWSSTKSFCGAFSIGPGSILEDCTINGWAGYWGGALCVSGPVVLRRVTLGGPPTSAPALHVSGCVTLQECPITPAQITPADACVRRVESKTEPADADPLTTDGTTWGQIKANYR